MIQKIEPTEKYNSSSMIRTDDNESYSSIVSIFGITSSTFYHYLDMRGIKFIEVKWQQYGGRVVAQILQFYSAKEKNWFDPGDCDIILQYLLTFSSTLYASSSASIMIKYDL